MILGNILTLFSVLIAIFSFAYSSNRRIIFYKFSICDVFIGIMFLLFVSYLLMFDMMQSWGLYIPSLCFEGNKFPMPEQWAYIITIVFLVYVIHRAFFSKTFPQKRWNALIDYYRELAESESVLLVSYIKEYHLKNLMAYIEKLNVGVKMTKKDAINSRIFNDIILNPDFIRETISHHNKMFFLEFVKDLSLSDIVGYKEAVKVYYRTLLQSHDHNLTEAINGTGNFLDNDRNSIRYRITDYKLCELTFGNLDFTYKLEVWRAFGEEGMRSAKMNNIFAKKQDEWLDEEYLKTPARLCLSFYDIFIREIIGTSNLNVSSQVGLFIYPYYLFLICDSALENVGSDRYNGLYVEKLVDDTISVLSDLLECNTKAKTLYFVSEMLDVFKSLIEVSKIPEQAKIKVTTIYQENYLEIATQYKGSNDVVKKYWEHIEQSCKASCLPYMKESWKRNRYDGGVDKVKYTNYIGFSELEKLLI